MWFMPRMNRTYTIIVATLFMFLFRASSRQTGLSATGFSR